MGNRNGIGRGRVPGVLAAVLAAGAILVPSWIHAQQPADAMRHGMSGMDAMGGMGMGHGGMTGMMPMMMRGMMGGRGMMPMGMMGGGMMGGGMMGGGMMGGGMMGGRGMMPMGMMGMGGMMPGMMGGPFAMLDLSDDQRRRLRAIQRETASKVRRLWVQMADEADRLRDLYVAERPDPKAIGRVYGKIFDIKRQIIEARVAARNRMMDVLTPAQRKRLREMRRRMRQGAMGMMGGSGQGAAGPGPMGGGNGAPGHRRMMEGR